MDTVRIKSSHPASQGPFVVINADTFDPAKHELWADDAQRAPVTAETHAPAPVGPEPDTAAPEPSEAVDIPDDWRYLPWPRLRALAASVSSDPVKSREDCEQAIEVEMERRK